MVTGRTEGSHAAFMLSGGLLGAGSHALLEVHLGSRDRIHFFLHLLKISLAFSWVMPCLSLNNHSQIKSNKVFSFRSFRHPLAISMKYNKKCLHFKRKLLISNETIIYIMTPAYLLCVMWLLTRWPAARADMSDSSPASTVAHTTLASCLAFSPGQTWLAPCTPNIWTYAQTKFLTQRFFLMTTLGKSFIRKKAYFGWTKIILNDKMVKCAAPNFIYHRSDHHKLSLSTSDQRLLVKIWIKYQSN